MNCFQIVSLTYWSQQVDGFLITTFCCELLSDCIFDILVTTTCFWASNSPLLWIAFRLYLWHIGHNKRQLSKTKLYVVNCFQIVSLTYWSQHIYDYMTFPTVVNCFQIVSLTYWSQRLMAFALPYTCCELLSDCIFDILVTTLTIFNTND